MDVNEQGFGVRAPVESDSEADVASEGSRSESETSDTESSETESEEAGLEEPIEERAISVEAASTGEEVPEVVQQAEGWRELNRDRAEMPTPAKKRKIDRRSRGEKRRRRCSESSSGSSASPNRRRRAVRRKVDKRRESKRETHAKPISELWKSCPLPKLKDDATFEEMRLTWPSWKNMLLDLLELGKPKGREWSEKEKHLTLMMYGGRHVREIDLLGAPVKKEEAENEGQEDLVFTTLIKRCDAAFRAKDPSMELSTLRGLKQETGENFRAFLERARRQISLCGFRTGEDRDRELMMLVKRNATNAFEISKFSSNCHTLEQVEEVALNLEAISREQLIGKMPSFKKEEKPEDDVHAIVSGKAEWKPQQRNIKAEPSRPFRQNESSCNRCGRRGGHERGYRCRAVDLTCFECGVTGHLAAVCRSKGRNQRQNQQAGRSRNQSFVNQLGSRADVNRSAGVQEGQARVWCKMGCRRIDFMIDSGSPVTTITEQMYENIREDQKWGRAKIYSVVEGGTRTLHGYGSREPLQVICSFVVKLEVAGHDKPSCTEEVFVVKNAKRALLGASAATAMKLLKVGVEVNQLEGASELGKGLDLPEPAESERFPSIPNFQLSFDIDESVSPRKDFRYNVPQSLEASLNDNLRKLTESGIIEPAPTTPTWVSRLKAVTKANGDIRWVVTMLGPNKAIRRVFYPMPTMDKLAIKLKGARFFTKLDIKNAFFHVELDEKSRQMTTFMTSRGPMRFTRLAFGVNCAPEAFQKIMEDRLRGLGGTVVFIDDILICGRTRAELRERTAAAKARLSENNLTLNDEKCLYEQESVEFLGYTISGSGMLPSQDKIRDVLACKRPKSVTAVRSFLGMVNFMASFISNLSHLSEPLRRVTCKTKSFEWTDEQESAFEKIKVVVANHVHKRGFFGENDETWLYTDASPVGLGAVLVQASRAAPGEEPVKRVIAFASKALSKTEAQYPQTQREALAVVWGVERFRFYLLGREFHLVVDHQPLAFIFTEDSKNGKRATTRAEGFALRLSMYRFDVVVVRSEMNIADYLSREGLVDCEPYVEQDSGCYLGSISVSVNPLFKSEIHPVTKTDIQLASAKDAETMAVKKAIEAGEWPKELVAYAAFQDELVFHGDALLRGKRFIVPKGLRGRMMRVVHTGHPGIVAMKRTLRKSVWWPGLDADVENHVKNCNGCVMVSRNSPPEPMSITRLPEEPWEYLAIDFCSPTSLGVKLLVVTDYYSRATMVRVMKETTASRTCDQLEDLFFTYGYPMCIRADNGPPFKSKEFHEWCVRRAITIIHSTPWAPWMNGEVESQMKAIKKVLMISVGENSDWKLCLQQHMYAYNRRVHQTTGEKPLEMLMKRKIRGLMPVFEDGKGEAGPDVEQARDKDRITKYSAKQVMDARRHAKFSVLEVGDVVYLENKTRQGLEPRFDPVPHTIVEKRGGSVLVEGPGGEKKLRATSQVAKAPQRAQEDTPEASVSPAVVGTAEDLVEAASGSVDEGKGEMMMNSTSPVEPAEEQETEPAVAPRAREKRISKRPSRFLT